MSFHLRVLIPFNAIQQPASCSFANSFESPVLGGNAVTDEISHIPIRISPGAGHSFLRSGVRVIWIFRPLAKLLKEKWHFRSDALIPQRPRPVRVHGSGIRTALAAADNPIKFLRAVDMA